MKYKLSRAVLPSELYPIVLREIRRQQIQISSASKKILKEILAVSQEIHKRGLPSRFICKKLPGKLGRGVFLHPDAQPIARGEVIASYAGELRIYPQNDAEDSDYAFAPVDFMRLTKEEQNRVDPTRKYHPRRLYELDLDAKNDGNFTRFINHSETPNVEARLLRIPKNSLGLTPTPAEIVYIAKKKIRPGEQLLVCYEGDESSYWAVLGIKPFPMTPTTFTTDGHQLIRSPGRMGKK